MNYSSFLPLQTVFPLFADIAVPLPPVIMLFRVVRFLSLGLLPQFFFASLVSVLKNCTITVRKG